MASGMTCDLAILGGGLAGGVIALALAERRPELRVLLVEGGDRLGGNHIWSFFDSDVDAADRALVAPFVCASWEGHDVAFPKHRRTLGGRYNSIFSERFDAVVRERLGSRVLTGAQVVAATATTVTLADQRQIVAAGVIDTRGAGDLTLLDLGWQKFVGQELRLAAPHGLDRPMIMDATVPQIDGYRFIYLLPFGPDRLFVEDTYYSDGPELDVPVLSERIASYAAARGWRIAEVVRTETGVLPVVIGGDFEAYWRSGGEGVAKAGVRAGLFHPTTGYSLPDAVRTASLLSGISDFGGANLHRRLHDDAKKRWRQGGFYRLLDAMLFRAAAPAERYRVLERFYGLNEKLIDRFYAGRSTGWDKFRILAGKPPVPIGRAIAALRETRQ